jgi:hypothetical protein
MGTTGMAPRTGLTVDQWMRDELHGVTILASGTTKESGCSIWWAAIDAPDEEGAYALCVPYTRGRLEWTYKIMDETVGPCYYAIPRNVGEALARNPRQRDGYALTWWNQTVCYTPKKRPKNGDVVTFDCKFSGIDTNTFLMTDRPSVFQCVGGNRHGSLVKLQGWTTASYQVNTELVTA